METLLKRANRLGVDPVLLLEPSLRSSWSDGSGDRMASGDPITVHGGPPGEPP